MPEGALLRSGVVRSVSESRGARRRVTRGRARFRYGAFGSGRVSVQV